MEQEQESAASSVMQKLEAFYKELDPQEKRVLSGMVRYSLLQAAGEMVGEVDEGEKTRVPAFVSGLRPTVAPDLVKSMNLPGAYAAYSPGCASRGLLELAKEGSV